jgi:hypothetical protein
MQIEFQKGGVFTAELLEKAAPKSCETIWNRLPFTYEFYHSIVSGRAILTLPPDLTMEPENQMVMGINPGTISFLVRDVPKIVPDEIYISYGIFVSRGLTVNAYQPVNVFAKINENLDELDMVCRRVLMKGAETVKFSKKGQQD